MYQNYEQQFPGPLISSGYDPEGILSPPPSNFIARAHALQQRNPGVPLLGSAAAYLHQLPTFHSDSPTLCVGNPTGSRAIPGAEHTRNWRNKSTYNALVRRAEGEFLVANPAATVVDLSMRGEAISALMAGDAWIGRNQARREELLETIAAFRGHAKISRAYLMSHIIGGHCESPRESQLKAELWRRGFPPTLLQATVRWAGQTYRPDFLFEEAGVILEYDGQGKMRGGADLEYAFHRANALSSAGFVCIHVTRQNFKTELLYQRIWEALETGAQVSRDCTITGGHPAWQQPFAKVRKRPKLSDWLG